MEYTRLDDAPFTQEKAKNSSTEVKPTSGKNTTKIIESDGTTTISYQINFDRWKAIAAGLYLEFLAGLIYAFPVYSGQLKQVLELTQTELSWCSTFGTMGGNLGIVAGISYDRYGPKATAQMGAIIAAVGFLGIYLTTTGALPFGVYAASFFYFVAYQGLTWMDTSTVGVQVTNFPKDKGLSVGLVKTQFGLASSAVNRLIPRILFWCLVFS